MPSIYSTYDLLRVFGGVYEVIDVRAAIIRDNEQWLLVALSVRFRIVSIETAQQDFQDAVDRFGKIDSPTFRIVQQCFPITESSRLFTMLMFGKLALEDLQIRHSNLGEIRTIPGNPRVDYDNMESWPCIELQQKIESDPNMRQLLLGDAEILRNTELAGYEAPHAAVKALLGVDYHQADDPGQIWIACDIPVRLLPPEVIRDGDELRLKLRAESHPAIHDVSCTIRRTNSSARGILQQSVVGLTRSNEERWPVSWSGDIKLTIKREDVVTLEALSRDVGRLYSINIRPFKLLPPEQANPLLAVLELFCPPDQVRVLLEEPQAAQKEPSDTKNPARLFEVTIQWLLSTLGYRAIWLHGYERIKNNNVEVGTIDCLAYSEDENLLLFVNCSLTAPNPSELHRQENLMTWISKRLFPESTVKVCSVLFAASHAPETGQAKAYGSAVKVFFKEDMGRLLQAARAGRKFDFSKDAQATILMWR